MNAIEFVKRYGLDKAKREIGYEGTMMQCNNMDGIINDLKQIVDAFELVEYLGGVDYCKCMIKLSGHDYLKKAINLVEQCQ